MRYFATVLLLVTLFIPALALGETVTVVDLVEKGEAPRKAYYALSSKEYENLSMDMAEITRYTKDILSIIKYYRAHFL